MILSNYLNNQLCQISGQVHRHDDGAVTLKLADFGLALVVTEPLYTVCGTPTYVAPEILAETGRVNYITAMFLFRKVCALCETLSPCLSLYRLWCSSGRVGNGSDPLHPALWVPSFPQYRAQSSGTL